MRYKVFRLSPPLGSHYQGFNQYVPMPHDFVLTPSAARGMLNMGGLQQGIVLDVTEWLDGMVHNVHGYRVYENTSRKITVYFELNNVEWNSGALYYHGEAINE